MNATRAWLGLGLALQMVFIVFHAPALAGGGISFGDGNAEGGAWEPDPGPSRVFRGRIVQVLHGMTTLHALCNTTIEVFDLEKGGDHAVLAIDAETPEGKALVQKFEGKNKVVEVEVRDGQALVNWNYRPLCVIASFREVKSELEEDFEHVKVVSASKYSASIPGLKLNRMRFPCVLQKDAEGRFQLCLSEYATRLSPQSELPLKMDDTGKSLAKKYDGKDVVLIVKGDLGEGGEVSVLDVQALPKQRERFLKTLGNPGDGDDAVTDSIEGECEVSAGGPTESPGAWPKHAGMAGGGGGGKFRYTFDVEDGRIILDAEPGKGKPLVGIESEGQTHLGVMAEWVCCWLRRQYHADTLKLEVAPEAAAQPVLGRVEGSSPEEVLRSLALRSGTVLAQDKKEPGTWQLRLP